MGIERCDDNPGFWLHDAIQVDEGKDVACRTAVGVGVYPLQVHRCGNARGSEAVEDCEVGLWCRPLHAVISLYDPIQNRTKGLQELGHFVLDFLEA